jgi:hypothetical protein
VQQRSRRILKRLVASVLPLVSITAGSLPLLYGITPPLIGLKMAAQ